MRQFCSIEGSVIEEQGASIGSYTYDGSKINAVSFVTENNIGDISTAQQDITYSSFLQPEEITELNRKLTYTYGSDLQRIKGEYKLNNTTQWTRYYFGDYEKVVDGTGTEHIHYISGGEGVVAIVSKKNNQLSRLRATPLNYSPLLR